MDLHKAWQQLQESHFQQSDDLRLSTVRDLMRHPGRSPLARLRRNIRLNTWFTLVFFVLFIVLFFVFTHPYVRLCLAVLIAAYLAAYAFTAYQLRTLPPRPAMDNDLLTTLKAYHRIFSGWMRVLERSALFIYPVSITGGFLVGLSGAMPIDEALGKPVIRWTLLIALLVLTPATHFLAKWMNRLAFGRYLDQLQENIAVLERREAVGDW